MSVKTDLENVVMLQIRELELDRIGRDLEAIESLREALQAEIRGAEQAVKSAADDLESSRVEVRRLELDLATAEEKVTKYKDQLLAVKRNEELWALQKEIDRAEAEVGEIETGILEHMEKADALEASIGVGRSELDEITKKVNSANAEADHRAAELEAEGEVVKESIEELRGWLPDDLLRSYESVKDIRGGVAVAEADDETCLACNVKLRPQLYVETFNLSEIVQCENCNRILYVADRIDVPGIGATAGQEPAADEEAAAERAPEQEAASEPAPEPTA